MDREGSTLLRKMKSLFVFLAFAQFFFIPTSFSSPASKRYSIGLAKTPLPSMSFSQGSSASKPNAIAAATSPNASDAVPPAAPKHSSPAAPSPKAPHTTSPPAAPSPKAPHTTSPPAPPKHSSPAAPSPKAPHTTSPRAAPKHRLPAAPSPKTLHATSPPAPSPKAPHAISPPAPKHRTPPAPPLDLSPTPGPSPSSSPSPSPEPPKSKHFSPPAPPADKGGQSESPSPSPLKPKHKSPPAPPADESPAPSPSESSESPISSSGTALDPKQLAALKSLGVSTVKDPCSPSQQKITVCDSAKPRHIISLQLQYCSPESHMTKESMETLSTLHSLTFMDCPMSPIRFPVKLLDSLTSFTCISSLGRTLEDQSVQGLSGVWLSRLHNLTKLTVSDVVVNASGPAIILSNMKHVRDVSISRTNLSGVVPKLWHANITSIDLSGNNLKGTIPSSMGRLFHLRTLDLSSNQLSGSIPSSVGKLVHLEKLALASNKLSGSIPSSLSEMPSLVFLDLSGNQLNGSIPDYLTELRNLRYLNLENNNFAGPVPFNATFIKKLSSFKISGNANVCYNHTTVPSKLKLGVPPCDSSGLPVVPTGSTISESPADSPDSAESGDGDHHSSHHHGPNKIVVGVAIALSSIVALIIFCVVLSRWCSRRD